MGERLAGGNVALALLANAIATDHWSLADPAAVERSFEDQRRLKADTTNVRLKPDATRRTF
jgi:hypothetical protein